MQVVSADNKPLKSINIKDGFVDVFLENNTIKQNITNGKISANNEKISEVNIKENG